MGGLYLEITFFFPSSSSSSFIEKRRSVTLSALAMMFVLTPRYNKKMYVFLRVFIILLFYRNIRTLHTFDNII